MYRRRAIAGLILAVTVVALFVYGVGWESVLEHVAGAHPAGIAAAALVGLVMLALRGAVVRQLLDPVDGAASGGSFVVAFLSGYFARSALPWGRSTGTPVTAYLLAARSDSEFEDNLAVVGVAEAFNLAASLVVAAVGVVLVAATIGAAATSTAATAIVGGGGLLAAGTAVVVLGRGHARAVTLEFATRVETVVSHVPRLPDVEGRLVRRIDGFFGTLGTLQASRRTLAAAFGLAVAGWVANAVPLYLCLLALGVDAPLSIALLCAPLASLGGVVPLPGGTGGVEVVLASLLVATFGVAGDTATAGAILYRLTTYWLHLGIGGLAAVYLSTVGYGRAGG